MNSTFHILIFLCGWMSIVSFAQDEDISAFNPSAEEWDDVTVKDVREMSRPKRLVDYNLPWIDEKVYLTTIVPWDVVQLIEFLAHKGGLKNIVITKDVAGLTTRLKFDGVTVGDALEVVLSVNNLAYEVRDDIITIMTNDEYRTLYGVSFYDYKKVEIVELKYADPIRIAAMLEKVKSSIGTLVADSVTGTLILIDTPEKIREMQMVIDKADIPTISRQLPVETESFILLYADVEDIQEKISRSLTKEAGSMQADTRTKTIIITDLPHSMEKIKQLIKAFDRPSKEVFIEAKIVQITLDDEYRLGIDWEHLFEGLNPRFSLNSTVKPPIVGARGAVTEPGAGMASLTYKTIFAGQDLKVILDALQTIGETRILSNPHIAVMDGHEAIIKVVRNEPYVEAYFESGTTNVVSETLRFIEVGVSLTVTPKINEDGFIIVDIKPEVSTVEGTYAARYSVPIVQKSMAETSVMVKNGQTIIIAGMIENMKSTRENRVPILGRIPLLGILFRSRSDFVTTKETIVFLTPRIITGEEPVLLMKDMKKEFKPLRPTGPDKIGGKKLKPIR